MKPNGGVIAAFVLRVFTASCCKRVRRLGHVLKPNRRSFVEQ